MIWSPCRACGLMVFADHPDPTCDECYPPRRPPLPTCQPAKLERVDRPVEPQRGVDGLIHSTPGIEPPPWPETRGGNPYSQRVYRTTSASSVCSGGLPSLGKRRP